MDLTQIIAKGLLERNVKRMMDQGIQVPLVSSDWDSLNESAKRHYEKEALDIQTDLASAGYHIRKVTKK